MKNEISFAGNVIQIIENARNSALKKVKELRDMLLELPYMDISITSTKETLAIELENAEAKRDEFASMINSKNYESVDTTLIKDRIAYITDKKEKLKEEISAIKEKIKKLDNQELEDLNNRINYCENEVSNLNDKIEEYEITLQDKDLTVSKKATLQASFDKKQEELNNVMELLNSYKNDRKKVILESYDLETKNIIEIEAEIKLLDEEIKKLEKLSVSSNKVKDIIAMENDKKTLKELNDTVKAIKKRQSLKNTPNEIYDEIEILLGTSDELSTMEEMNDVDINETIEVENNQIDEVLEIDDLNSFDFEPINIELEDINFEEDNVEIKEDVFEPVHVIDDDIFNVEMTDINNEEKLKVINIESLNDSTSSNEESENNDFLIGNYMIEE